MKEMVAIPTGLRAVAAGYALAVDNTVKTLTTLNAATTDVLLSIPGTVWITFGGEDPVSATPIGHKVSDIDLIQIPSGIASTLKITRDTASGSSTVYVTECRRTS